MAVDRYALGRQVLALLEEDLQAIGFELVDVRIFRGGGRLQVRIYVDTEGGVDLAGCTRASRTAEMLLEESDLFTDRYVIEVSSPGVRRPLRKPAHYAASVGQEVDVRFGSPERPEQARGRLIAASEKGIRIQIEAHSQPDAESVTEEISLDYAGILEANLEADFDAQALIQADRRRRKEEKRKAKQLSRRSKTRRARRPKA